MRYVALAAVCAALSMAGCSTSQVVPAPGQATGVQNGRQAAVSRGAHSVVSVRAAPLINDPGGREQFVVEIQNTSDRPIPFAYTDVSASNAVTGAPLRTMLPDEAKADLQISAVASAITLGGATAVAGVGVAPVSTVGATAIAAGGGLATGLVTADRWTTASRVTEVMLPAETTIPPKAILSGLLLMQPIMYDPKAYLVTVKVGGDTHVLAFTSG